jgi:hypothetical protein
MKEPGIEFGIHKVVDMLSELATNMEGAGLLALPVEMGKHLFDAIGKAHSANERAATSFGVRHALSVVWGDHKHPDNAHIKEGRPYTYGELRERVATAFGKEKEAHMPFWSVENKNAPDQYQNGVDLTVDRANSALQSGKTAAERQVLLKAFTDSAERAAQQQMNQELPGEGF